VDANVARQLANIVAELLAAQRQVSINDAPIAAIAIVGQIPVVTQDSHFDATYCNVTQTSLDRAGFLIYTVGRADTKSYKVVQQLTKTAKVSPGICKLALLFLFLMPVTAIIVTSGPESAFAQSCSVALDCTNPESSCVTGAYTVGTAELTYYGANLATVNLVYSPSCRTTWSLLTDFSTCCSFDDYPWVNRQSGPAGDTYGLCDYSYVDTGDDYYSHVWSAQLNDAGYTSLAWGGVPDGMTSCGSPTGSLETYINTWPPF